MDDPFLQRMRIYLHLVPIFGVIPSLWTLYTNARASKPHIHKQCGEARADGEDINITQLKSVSKLSVLMGLSAMCAIALFGAAANAQPSQIATLRLLIGSSFIGSGYFLLSLALMFRAAKGQSVRLPGLTPLSRRLL